MPAPAKALVFRVVSRTNKGYEKLAYGTIPIAAGDPLVTLEGTSTTAPENGVLAGRSYTPTSLMWKTTETTVYDSTDMWYLPREYRDILFEITLKLTPATLRVQPEIPKGTRQSYFQKTRVALDISKDWGWQRGTFLQNQTVNLEKRGLGCPF